MQSIIMEVVSQLSSDYFIADLPPAEDGAPLSIATAVENQILLVQKR